MFIYSIQSIKTGKEVRTNTGEIKQCILYQRICCYKSKKYSIESNSKVSPTKEGLTWYYCKSVLLTCAVHFQFRAFILTFSSHGNRFEKLKLDKASSSGSKTESITYSYLEALMQTLHWPVHSLAHHCPHVNTDY